MEKRMFLKALDQIEEWLIAFLMGGATLIIFAAVAHRFALDMSAKYHFDAVYDKLFTINMSWAQELCIYMFVWMAKFGAAYGVRTGIHVGVDVLINRFEPKVRGRFIIFSLLAGAVFTGSIAVLGGHFVWDNGMHYAVFHALGLDTGDLPEGPITPDLEWPTWAVYSAIPLGSSLMSFRFLQVLWHFLHTGELPQHDESHVEGLDDIKTIQIDTNPYGMDDNLHMHDTIQRESEQKAQDKK
jgi:C4-dicarboxylate transporter DctQ subunit